MRSTFSAGLAAFALIAGLGAVADAQAAPLKLAYVNVDVLMPNVPGYAQAESLYMKDAAVWDGQLKSKQDSAQKMQDAYNKALPTMSDSVRAARAKPIQDFIDGARAFQTTLENKAAARQTELFTPLKDEVQSVLDTFRAENGYAFIFRVGGRDASGAGDAAVFVTADKNLDVTDRILARLKALPIVGTVHRPPGS
jgi:Skp family chaperone for outer membrane proteins